MTEVCENGHEQSWADRTFGCGRCGQRKTPGISFSRTLSNPYDYREDLAAYPGDPEAFVSSKTDVDKLVDKRLREGWERTERKSSPRETHKKTSDEIVREAYQRASAKGFNPDGGTKCLKKP